MQWLVVIFLHEWLAHWALMDILSVMPRLTLASFSLALPGVLCSAFAAKKCVLPTWTLQGL